MAQVEQSELLAILGHEIGHWRLGHTVQGFVISQVSEVVGSIGM
jgi:STE24 endopeptidase